MKLKTRDLAVFEAVALSGSIQEAAERIGLTQSAVTRSVHRLEEALQSKLLDREHRPVLLTRDGKRALDEAQTVLRALRHMESAFDDGAEPSGEFRLGLPHALTHVLLKDEALLGLSQFPMLRPKITSGWSSELHRKIAQRQLDAAITIDAPGRDVSANVTARILATAHLCAVGHTDLQENLKSLRSANEIGWALNPEGCGYRAALLRALERIGAAPNIKLETNSFETQLLLASRGQVLSLAPNLTNSELLNRYGVGAFALDELSQSLEFALSSERTDPQLQPVFIAMENAARRALLNV